MIPQALLEKFGRTYQAGDIVFCEFEAGSECFVVHEGDVSIIKISGGVEKVLAILKAGDIFGEMGVLEKKPRTATALALTELTVLALDLRGLQMLVTAQPDFAFKLGKMLGYRIMQSYRHLSNLAIDNPRIRVVDILLWKVNAADGDEHAREQDHPVTPFSSNEIADFAGLSYPEVDRVLKEFSELGRIRTYVDKVEILDIRSLRRLLR